MILPTKAAIEKIDDGFDEMIRETMKSIKSKLPYGFGPCEYPLEQKRIRLIRYLRRYGRTADQIAGFLNGCGQCRRGGQLWWPKNVRYIMRKYPIGGLDLKDQPLPTLDELLELFGLRGSIGKIS